VVARACIQPYRFQTFVVTGRARLALLEVFCQQARERFSAHHLYPVTPDPDSLKQGEMAYSLRHRQYTKYSNSMISQNVIKYNC
jgi:hypothetical protein